jgi:hypothetical protein
MPKRNGRQPSKSNLIDWTTKRRSEPTGGTGITVAAWTIGMLRNSVEPIGQRVQASVEEMPVNGEKAALRWPSTFCNVFGLAPAAIMRAAAL